MVAEREVAHCRLDRSGHKGYAYRLRGNRAYSRCLIFRTFDSEEAKSANFNLAGQVWCPGARAVARAEGPLADSNLNSVQCRCQWPAGRRTSEPRSDFDSESSHSAVSRRAAERPGPRAGACCATPPQARASASGVALRSSHCQRTRAATCGDSECTVRHGPAKRVFGSAQPLITE